MSDPVRGAATGQEGESSLRALCRLTCGSYLCLLGEIPLVPLTPLPPLGMKEKEAEELCHIQFTT